MIIRFILGLVVLILFIVSGVLVFGVFGINNSLPQYEGSIPTRFAAHELQIYRDSFAISHIYAKTDADAYYGLGYAHAQERLSQMDLTRRIGEGKLSEIIGEKGLQIDRWSRTIGFSRIAEIMWTRSSAKTRSFLAAYANGVNDYIAEHRGTFGFEFDGLSYEPQYWKPTDCMIIGRLMSWEMNFSFWNDAAFADIAKHLDREHLQSLYPAYPSFATTVLNRAVPTVIPTLDSMGSDSASATPIDEISNPALSLASDSLGSYFLPSAAGGGSNCVVLGPSKTSTKSAMLENDMHLFVGAPARFYITHLHSDEGLNVAGFTVPGMPLVLSGRNNDISWGVTNGMIDECDYFTLTLDSGGSVYRTSTGSDRVKTTSEVIRIRTNDPDSPFRLDTITVRSTATGVIVSDIPTFAIAKTISSQPNRAISDEIFTKPNVVALQWTGLFAEKDELGSLFRLHTSSSIENATTALNDFSTPCLNICLASRKSNEIAYRQIGQLPNRSGSEEQLLLPRNAANDRELWHGFTSLISLSSSENPSNGYFVTANNPPYTYRQPPQGENWEPPGRSQRLTELVSGTKKIDAKQLIAITSDISSPFEYNELRPALLNILKDDSVAHHRRLTSLALDYIQDWNGVQDSNDVATTILQVFLTKLIVNCFHDELGDARFNELTYVNNVTVRTIERLLREPDNIWWDDVRSIQRENRDEIIRRTFYQSIAWLSRSMGNDVRSWNWGKLHYLTYLHPASAASPLVGKLANVVSGRAPGSLTTVVQSSYTLWSPFLVRVVPSMRMVADMSSTSLLVALPTGNSGNIFGSNYRDMLELFKKGELIELNMQRIDPSWKKLNLQRKGS